MNFLKPDQNNIYNLQILKKEKIYIRTGIHADGSCFFHAFLRATKKYYKYSNYEERCAAVSRIREQLADRVNEETLSKLNNNEIRKMLFFTSLRKIIQSKKGFPADTYGEILNKIINLEILLDSLSVTDKENFYISFITKIQIHCNKVLKEKSTLFTKYINDWCYITFKEANDNVLYVFRNRLLHDQVESDQIEYIARALKYNFLFIHDDLKGNQSVYPLSYKIEDMTKPFIVLIWISECHYELFGELNKDKSITRVFNADHDIIKTLISYS